MYQVLDHCTKYWSSVPSNKYLTTNQPYVGNGARLESAPFPTYGWLLVKFLLWTKVHFTLMTSLGNALQISA